MTSQSPHREVSSEGRASQSEVRESFSLTVRQPEKITSLLAVLSDLEKISERIGEDRSSDLGAAGTGGAVAQAGAGASGVSLRQQALQSLPSTVVMQQRLLTHLTQEVRQLERSARKLARSTRRGSAYLLTQTYARIRKIEALIHDLIEAAAEMIERLYVRLFIDHQQLV